MVGVARSVEIVMLFSGVSCCEVLLDLFLLIAGRRTSSGFVLLPFVKEEFQTAVGREVNEGWILSLCAVFASRHGAYDKSLGNPTYRLSK